MQIRGLRPMKSIALAILAASVMLTPVVSPAASTPARKTEAPKPRKTVDGPRLILQQFEAPSLLGNATNQPTAVPVRVLLPPSYYTHPERRFPVIYFLHGYGSRTSITQNVEELDSFMTVRGMQEFIIVEPTSANAFYANSRAKGNWEDVIAKDLVSWTDARFRTVADPSARGISGFSMGGFGAFYLGLRHPDVFQAVFAMASGLVDDDDLKTMKESWNETTMNDYAMSFAPDPANPAKGLIPKFDGSPADEAILQQWREGFGHIEKKVAAYKASGKRLAGLGVLVGTGDSYRWLIQGAKKLDQVLNREGIPHRFELTEDNHTFSEELIPTRILPFFSFYLSGNP